MNFLLCLWLCITCTKITVHITSWHAYLSLLSWFGVYCIHNHKAQTSNTDIFNGQTSSTLISHDTLNFVFLINWNEHAQSLLVRRTKRCHNLGLHTITWRGPQSLRALNSAVSAKTRKIYTCMRSSEELRAFTITCLWIYKHYLHTVT